MVFITYEKADGTWAECIDIRPPEEWKGNQLKYGADLEFVDDSTLIVAVQLFNVSAMTFGTLLYRREGENDWNLKEIIVPPEPPKEESYSDYGTYISMPFDNQSILGVQARFEFNKGVFYIFRKGDNTTEWPNTPSETIINPESGASGIYFCDQNVFASVGDNQALIYEKNSTGQFNLEVTIVPEIYNKSGVSFGSDVAWRSDCKALVVGAMNKEPFNYDVPEVVYKNSLTYVYELRETTELDDNSSSPKALMITGITLGAVVVCVIIFLIVFSIVRNREGEGPGLTDEIV